MVRRKVTFGILIFLGFAMVTILYIFVMGGTAEVHGTVQVSSQLVSWEENPPGQADTEMVSVNGYCIKGPDTENRMLLSTKNKNKTGQVKYSFTAKEGMRHAIVIYLQLNHLTGATGQNMELQFLTDIVKKGDLERDFMISFEEINGIDSIRITKTGADYGTPKVLEFPLSEMPDTIKI